MLYVKVSEATFRFFDFFSFRFFDEIRVKMKKSTAFNQLAP